MRPPTDAPAVTPEERRDLLAELGLATVHMYVRSGGADIEQRDVVEWMLWLGVAIVEPRVTPCGEGCLCLVEVGGCHAEEVRCHAIRAEILALHKERLDLGEMD